MAAPVLVVAALILAASYRPARVAWPAALIVLAAAAGLTTGAGRAAAHDPGEGPKVSTIELAATSDGHGQIAMTATLAGGCNHTAPVSVVARRAGRTITAPLHSTGACTYAGSLAVTERGRWFTYVELDDNGRRAEAWLPVDAGVAGHRAQSRTLYRPAGSSPGHRSAEIAAGAPIYLAGFLILGVGILAARRLPRNEPTVRPQQ